ncbi:MAG: hypothetical protein ACM32O_09325 [Clostridia bacterium]
MGQLVTTIISILLVLLVPLGIVQVHTALQMENELLELSLASTKFVSNRGGTSDTDVMLALDSYIQLELSQKQYRLDRKDIKVNLMRSKIHNPPLWSHEDVFQVRLEIPYPVISQLFASWQQPLQTVRTGTVNTMDYDL